MADCKRGKCARTARVGYRGFCQFHHDAFMRESGIPRGYIEATPVREHLLSLRECGFGSPRLATLSGLPKLTIERIRDGKVKRVLRRVAEPIMEIEPHMLAAGALTSPVGSMRRLQSLIRIGYNIEWISAEINRDAKTLARISTGKASNVTVDVARDIRSLFGRLQMTEGPCPRARIRAERAGWSMPLGWDEDEMDDPDAEPFIPKASGDRAVDYANLKERGLSDAAIAKELGISKGALSVWLKRRREAK